MLSRMLPQAPVLPFRHTRENGDAVLDITSVSPLRFCPQSPLIAVCAQELSVAGSYHYLKDRHRGDLVANVNMDMVWAADSV